MQKSVKFDESADIFTAASEVVCVGIIRDDEELCSPGSFQCFQTLVETMNFHRKAITERLRLCGCEIKTCSALLRYSIASPCPASLSFSH